MDLMDRHVAWLKRVALSRTLVRLTLEAVLVGDLALFGLIARGTDRWIAIPWALVAGIAFAILRFVLALNINPVSYRFIKRFSVERINHQIEMPLDLAEPTIEDSAASFLHSVNMTWVATVGDDAGITLRYSERIATGKGFNYNDGESINGCSNPLYALIEAGLLALGVEPAATLRGISVSCFAGTAFLLFWTFARFYSLGAACFAVLLLASAPKSFDQLFDGLETPLVIFLGALLFRCLLYTSPSPRDL